MLSIIYYKGGSSMYCSKCGTELPEGAKFCLKCGQKIVDATIFDKAQEISNELKNIIEADIITESEKTTKINSLSHKLKIKFANLWNSLNKFGKIVIVCLTISILLCFISFVSGRIFSGIISLIQIGLLIAAYLINNKILNIKNEYLHLWLVIAAIILVIPYFCLFKFDITSMDFSIDSEKTNSSEILEEFQWPNNELTNMLPAPKSNIGYIQQDSPNEFSIYVANTSKKDYKDYIEECGKNGFTNIVLEKADFYSVNKEDGYRLALEYEEENAMIITIKVPSYSVLIEMDCISNLIFNKYNIDVYIDGNKIAALQHGNQDTLEIELDKGSHTLKVTKENESSISGAAAFDVSDTIKISFELYCQSDKITLTEKYIEILSPLAEE